MLPTAQGGTAAALPPGVLARICSLLPPGDALLTVPRLNTALAAAGAPRAAQLRQEAEAAAQKATLFDASAAFKSFSVPLWALQEAWPQLEASQRMRAVARAAFHGDLTTLRWALPQQGNDGALYCAAAAAGGQLKALQFTRRLDCAWEVEDPDWPWAKNAGVAAASGGHLAVLQWARAQQPPCPWDALTCTAAAEGGHLAVLQWARSQPPPCPWDESTCTAAAYGGHLAVLQWARAQQPPCPWDEETCRLAARQGQLAALEWLRAQQPPCPWDKSTCIAAASGGQLAVLQWARSQRPPCPWDESTCTAAAYDGQLAVLQWARAQQPPCPWGVSTCIAAAFRGHLAVLQWARAQQPPCPWDEKAFTAAASGGHLAVLQWARPTAAVPMGRAGLHGSRSLRPPDRAAVGPRPATALPLGRQDLPRRCARRRDRRVDPCAGGAGGRGALMAARRVDGPQSPHPTLLMWPTAAGAGEVARALDNLLNDYRARAREVFACCQQGGRRAIPG